MKRKQNIKHRNRRGTATMEFVLCIPICATLFLGIFFLGWTMQDQQWVRTADRYASWRHVHNRDAEADAADLAYIELGEPDESSEQQEFIEKYTQVNVVEITTELLNELFFWERGENIVLEEHGGNITTREDLVEQAKEQGSDCGILAEDSVIGHFSHGRSARVYSEFQTDNSAWQKMASGAITSRHVRDGTSWRRWQSSYLDPIRENFLFDLDTAVMQITTEELRENLRRIYSRRW